MAVVNDLTVPSTNDFDALTNDYQGKVLVDNIFRGTPFLQKARQNMIGVSGKSWTPLLEYGSESGEWYTSNSQLGTMTTPSTQIATRAAWTLFMYRRKVYLAADVVDQQGSEAIVDIMAAHVKNATESMRMNWSTASMSTVSNACTNVGSIADNITGTVGGLNGHTTGYYWWQSHAIEGTDTWATATSPSLRNLEKMIRSMRNTNGQQDGPDLIVVSEDYWDVLAAQISSNQYAAALQANMTNDVVKWGFSALFLDGVPVVSDRDAPGSAWVPAQSTRTTAAGYEALLLNFNHLKFAYNKGRSFKWDPDGWRRPLDYDAYVNYIYLWGTFGTDSRRALGHVFNVDITQDIDSFTAGTVELPNVSARP